MKDLVLKEASIQEAFNVVDNLKAMAKDQLKNAKTNYLAGSIAAAFGAAIIMIVLLGEEINIFLIYGGLILIGGLVQMANASNRKTRYTVIIENIQSEENDREVKDKNLFDD